MDREKIYNKNIYKKIKKYKHPNAPRDFSLGAAPPGRGRG